MKRKFAETHPDWGKYLKETSENIKACRKIKAEEIKRKKLEEEQAIIDNRPVTIKQIQERCLEEFKAHIEAKARDGGSWIKVIVGKSPLVDGYICHLYNHEKDQIINWIVDQTQDIAEFQVLRDSFYGITFSW